MPKSLVSIVMPVYNCEKYVAESINSILNQDYQPIELICVDDGSTDQSLHILQSFGDKITIVHSEKNCGIASGRNKGAAIAHGEYIAFADADDIWQPEKLSKQIDQFENNPELDISFCMIQNFISPDVSEEIKNTRSFLTEPIPGHISGAFVAKKKSFDIIGPLDETLRVGEFIEWMTRAHDKKLQHTMVPEVLYLRRVHATNTTLNRDTKIDYLKIAKAALDRKRSQSL